MTGINILLSKKFAWKINDLSTENLLDPVLNYTECNVLVGAENDLTSMGPQTTTFHGGQYMTENGNMRNVGFTNPHGTAFAEKQWLY